MTIDRWIVDAANSRPSHIALTYKQQQISYLEFSRLIDTRTDALVDAGIKLGDRIAWYGLNNPEVFVLLFACARVGAILVPLNWRLADPEIASIVANCEPSFLFYDAHFSSQAQALPNVFAVSVKALQNTADRLPEVSQIANDFLNHTDKITTKSPLLLVYTSGSTGLPKGALLSQQALISNALMSVDAHRMTPDDKALVALPLFHVGGLNILPTPAFSIGATVILHEKFEPDAVCADLQNATLAITVPTVLQAIMSSQHWPSLDLSSLKGMSIGSTDVPLSFFEQIHALNIPLIQVYGATETSPFAIYQTIDEAMSSVGSIGRAGCDCEIRLVMDGKDVAISEPGEIWVKGDNVLLEYWRDESLTSTSIIDGWLRTGDVASVDENGLYWFKDRIKHVIISGGENIYPTEIERVLSKLAGVDEVSVVGIPDDKWGEIPVAVIASSANLSESQILTALNGQLARYKHPKRVAFVDALPRNAMGKVVADQVKSLIRGQFT